MAECLPGGGLGGGSVMSPARMEARGVRRRVCVALAVTMLAVSCLAAVVHDAGGGGGSTPGRGSLSAAGASTAARMTGLAGREPILAEGGEKEGGEKGRWEKAEGGSEGEGEEGTREKEIQENAIKARWGFAFVTIIILFSVAFVQATDYIKEAVPEDLEEVVLALMEELTTLGFLGFAFFITTVDLGGSPSLIEQASIYALNEPEALKELFEGLHYLVFFVSLSFILCTVGGLWSFQFGPSGSVAWRRYEEKGEEVCRGGNVGLLAIDKPNINAAGRLLSEWFQEDSVLQAEYLRIRTRFIEASEEPHLDPDFDFHKYLQKRVGETFSSMIEIEWRDWALTWTVLLLFWSVVQEGMIMEKLLFLYGFFMLIVMSLCIILQAKVVWVKAQLIPRMPTEMRTSWAAESPRFKLAPPVFEDQRMITVHKHSDNKMVERFWDYVHELMALVNVHKGPGSKHQRLFWFGSWGPEIMLHMIRLSMLWVIISLALFLSHHLPGIISLGTALGGGRRWVGYIFFGLVAAYHIAAMSMIYVTARIYTVCTSIEQLQDKELIEKIVREQKYQKCSKAIEMLFTLNYYMEHAQMLKQQTQGGSAISPRSLFVPETPEEQKAWDDLEELFMAFDADNSGELDSTEVKDLLKTMGTNLDEDELTKLIQLMDADGSGTISFDELAAVMLNKKKLNGAKTKLSDVGKQLFDMFDTDGEGTIQVEEMIETFGKMGKNWDMEQVHVFFDLIDTDGSGSVDRDEFMDFINELEQMRK